MKKESFIIGITFKCTRFNGFYLCSLHSFVYNRIICEIFSINYKSLPHWETVLLLSLFFAIVIKIASRILAKEFALNSFRFWILDPLHKFQDTFKLSYCQIGAHNRREYACQEKQFAKRPEGKCDVYIYIYIFTHEHQSSFFDVTHRYRRKKRYPSFFFLRIDSYRA